MSFAAREEVRHAREARAVEAAPVRSEQVERFCKTTRWFHWSFALSFLTLAATGIALASRGRLGLGAESVETLVSVHLHAAALLLLAPALVLLSGETRRTLADLALPFRWSRDDLRWLARKPLESLGRAELPPAGKLNAGQKVNALASMGLALGFACSGLWLWIRPGSLVAWFLHLSLVLAWLPLFAGHLSLALVIRTTRPALPGMLSGRVGREWARHHHPAWVRELEQGAEGDAQA